MFQELRSIWHDGRILRFCELSVEFGSKNAAKAIMAALSPLYSLGAHRNFAPLDFARFSIAEHSMALFDTPPEIPKLA